MSTSIIATVGIAALVAWLGFLAVRYVLPRVQNPVTTIASTRQAARERVLRDPLDYVRAWVARIAPARMKAERRVEATRATIDQARERKARVLTGFWDGKEPSFGFTVFALILFIAWLISVTAVFIIDVPIVTAVSGGNFFFGVVGTVLLVALPVIFSVLLGHFFVLWRRGEMHTVLFSAALIGIVALVVGIVWYLATLAPMRAEVEYADKIRTVEQQLVGYREDADQNAINFAELELTELTAQQERSAEWNTVLVPLAATAEFATGFFLPMAIPILLLADIESSRRKAERAQATALNRVNDQRARQYARLSRRFQRLGLPQLELQEHLAAVAAENRLEATEIQAARNTVAEELRAQGPTGTSDEPNDHRQEPVDGTITAEDAPVGGIHETTPAAGRPEPERERSARSASATPVAPRRTGTESAPDVVLEREDPDRSDTSFNLN
jgi:hypothetical protein